MRRNLVLRSIEYYCEGYKKKKESDRKRGCEKELTTAFQSDTSVHDDGVGWAAGAAKTASRVVI